MLIYRSPLIFDVPHDNDHPREGWTYDCGQKQDYDPHFIDFSCRVYPDGSYACSLMMGDQYLLRKDRLNARNDVETAILEVEAWVEKVTRDFIALIGKAGIIPKEWGEDVPEEL